MIAATVRNLIAHLDHLIHAKFIRVEVERWRRFERILCTRACVFRVRVTRSHLLLEKQLVLVVAVVVGVIHRGMMKIAVRERLVVSVEHLLRVHVIAVLLLLLVLMMMHRWVDKVHAATVVVFRLAVVYYLQLDTVWLTHHLLLIGGKHETIFVVANHSSASSASRCGNITAEFWGMNLLIVSLKKKIITKIRNVFVYLRKK